MTYRRMGGAGIRRGLRAPSGPSAAPPVIDLPIRLGLYTWLRGDRGVVAPGGSAVDSWESLGSLATLFTNTGTARPSLTASNPALNGHPTVRFAAASSQYLASVDSALANALMAGAYTFFAVFGRTPNGANQTIWALGDSASSVQTLTHLRLASGVDSLYVQNAAGNTQNTGTVSDGSAPCLHTATYSGALLNTWTNAVPSVVNGSNARSVVCDRSYLGTQRFNGGHSSFLNADLAELIIYGGAVLSPEDIAYTTAHLKVRYNLNAVPGFDRADLGLVAGFDADPAYAHNDGVGRNDVWTARWSYDLAGAPVAPWTVQQTTPTARPLIEATGLLGKPSLYFTADDYLATPDGVLAGLLDGAQPITIYAVIDRDNPDEANSICALGVAGVSQTYITFRTDDVAVPGADIGDRFAGTGNGAGRGTSPVGTSPVILTHQWDGTTIRGWRGAALSYTRAATVQPICDRLYVGVQRFNGAMQHFMNGRMSMLLLFRVAHNAEQQAYVRGLLRASYPGLTLT